MTKTLGKDYLLDTNIVSMLFRAKNGDMDVACQSVLAQAIGIQNAGMRAYICAATVGELEYGMAIANRPDTKIHSDLRALINSFPVIHAIDKHVAAESYACLRAKLFRKYASKDARGKIKGKYPEEMVDPTTGKLLGIQENDLWIVSVAMTYDLIFVTHDRMEHIRQIVGADLDFEDWC